MKIISVFFLLLHATWVAEAKINVEGFEGGHVTFQCAHRLAWRNDKYLCSNECRSGDDKLVTVKYGQTAQSGRITLVDSRNGSFIVNLSQLQLSDSGRYWCAVDRLGLDTFTEVHLSVKKAGRNDITTLTLDVTSTWTYLSVSTQLSSQMDTSGPTNVSTASNYTQRVQEDFGTSTALYATLLAVSILTILVFAASFRKCREILKLQQQPCSNSGVVSADERETDYEYDDVDVEVPSVKTSSTGLDPPKSDVVVPIYENIGCSGGANDHNITSRMYISPLPYIESERTRHGSKHTNEPTANNLPES